MKRCVSCKQEADYIWQPFGPGEIMIFAAPGFHYRGFAALPLCDACKVRLETDDAEGHPHLIRFVYRKEGYSGTRHLLDVNPYGAQDDAELVAALANHNRVLEEMKATVAPPAVPASGVCHCACHTYQGTYPTSAARPCWVCGHYEEAP